MDAVKKDVEILVKMELEAANKKFPMFRSAHEGTAVIFEEYQEAEEQLRYTYEKLKHVWELVKSNCISQYMFLPGEIKEHAIYTAIECIQVAAMAQKFIDSEK